MTANLSKIYYLLASENAINRTYGMKIEIGPHVEINSDHDYLQLDMFFGEYRESRDDRRKHYRYPDYLLLNENFIELLSNRIKTILKEKISECKLLKSNLTVKNSFKG